MQAIEAQNLQGLGFGTADAKSLTLSFWVKSNKTGNATVELKQSDNSNKMLSLPYTLNSANTWEYKTVSIPADSAGIINNDNGKGLEIQWWLNSGSTFTGGTNQTSWSTSIAADRNATNFGLGGSTNDYFQITGVQLEVGESATEFEHRPYTTELQLCQRYYFKPAGAYINSCGFKYGTSVFASIPLPVTMRANPTFVQTTGATWYQGGGTYTYTPVSIGGSVDFVHMTGTASGGLDGGAGTMYPNFTASAEL